MSYRVLRINPSVVSLTAVYRRPLSSHLRCERKVPTVLAPRGAKRASVEISWKEVSLSQD